MLYFTLVVWPFFSNFKIEKFHFKFQIQNLYQNVHFPVEERGTECTREQSSRRTDLLLHYYGVITSYEDVSFLLHAYYCVKVFSFSCPHILF
jgi:hypothetical protein